ncbi:MAG: hypothetical protein V1859_09835 [archaeon]
MVELKIDTNKDSKEDIRKVIEYLRQIVEDDKFIPAAAKEESESSNLAFDMLMEKSNEKSDNNEEYKEIIPEKKEKGEEIKFKPIFY